ncbi:MFS transporter [Rhodobacteraceae bacterium RKSG542]|uniref:MFS transporter n=1 Tax=Pseudovibrio flavus TaxID=2529854 RepID=UPI0012BCC1FE|nr:MFS transporter [Pseudovibrio flavus]MTI16286.1 MFS transporter [Pseudovibrio flavus]
MELAQTTRSSKDISLIRLIFFMQPIIFGAWFPRIAQVQTQLGVSDGALAIALTGMPIGLMLTLTFAGGVVGRYGLRPVFLSSFVFFFIAIPAAAASPSIFILFGMLALAGVTVALLELAMNVAADQIERRSGKLIMSSCHGFWSLGVLVGSLIGSWFAYQGISPFHSLGLIGLIMLAPCLFAVAALSDISVPTSKEAKSRPRLTMPLILLCLFLFGIALTEGAMADWSAIFMRDIFGANDGEQGLAYSAFAGCMALGRFCGDALRASLGAKNTARLTVLLCIVGLFTLVASPVLELSLLGFALMGLGASTGFPLAITAASEKGGTSPAANVALVSQIGMAGFLIGPLIIGTASDFVGIKLAFLLMFPLLLMSLFTSASVTQKTDQ